MPDHRVSVTRDFVKQTTALMPGLKVKAARRVAAAEAAHQKSRGRLERERKAEHAADQAVRRARAAVKAAEGSLSKLQAAGLPSYQTKELAQRLRDAETLVAAYDARIARLLEVAAADEEGASDARAELEPLQREDATLCEREAAGAAAWRDFEDAAARISTLRQQIAQRRHQHGAACEDLESCAAALAEAPCGDDLKAVCPHLAAARNAREALAALRDDDIVEMEVRLAETEAEAERLQPLAHAAYDREAHAQVRARLGELRAVVQATERSQRAAHNAGEVSRQRDRHFERQEHLREEHAEAVKRDEHALQEAREAVAARARSVGQAAERLEEARNLRAQTVSLLRKQHKRVVEARAALRSLVLLEQQHKPEVKGAQDG